MTWFEQLTGFSETSPAHVRQNIRIDGETLTSTVNGKSWSHGRLEIPSLAELRERIRSNLWSAAARRRSFDIPVQTRHAETRISVREVVADSRSLHANVSNANSLFQVASQFNLLEMIGPHRTPEHGVGIYEDDRTQGPACAVAAGAGTIYRNYFAEVNGQIGQSHDNQIDCLADIGRKLGNTGNQLWEMRNGYALATRSGLNEISTRLRSLTEAERDELRQSLRIGLQWDTQVTLNESTHTVSQAYCSALPVAYSNHPGDLWEPFARLVLEATYEATVCAAILNSQNTLNDHKERDRVFLTLVGGGAFGNDVDWILGAIRRALDLYQGWKLDVAIVSYGTSKPEVQQLTQAFSHNLTL